MELGNWSQTLLIILGLLILWGLVGLVLRLARRVISCGCSLIIAVGLLYFIWYWVSNL